MAASWSGKLSSNRERAARELVQGQEFATHLQFLLKKHYRDDELLSADELVVKIVRSFTEALSLVTCYDFVENFQNQTTSQVDSVCCDDRKSEDSGESKKRATAKERRGCYKRKKISQSWTTVSATTEDGYAWRKYGQKQILNTKYPRSYFRCTHKYDQGCKATKQVQIMEEDPQMYGTTYIGHHTCRDIHKVPQIVTPPDSSPGHESYMLTYSNSNNTPTQLDYQHHPFTLCPSTMFKQEYKEETPSDLTDELSSLDSMWKDLAVFEPADHYRAVASTACTETASQSLDMDFAVSSVEFNGDFHFDESEFNYLSK